MNDFYANQIVTQLKELNHNVKELNRCLKEVERYGL
jgi:hypothetical protein